MIVVVDPDRRFRARVVEQLDRKADLLEVDRIKQSEGLMAEHAEELTVLLLGPSLPAAGPLALADGLRFASPEVSVVLVTPDLTPDVLQAALRAGIRDVLPASFTPRQLKAAVENAEKISRQMRERSGRTIALDAPDPNNRVVTVLSQKGGVGKSFVASNLAVLLARRQSEVALVDLDLQSGDLGIMFQVRPVRTIYDAAQGIEHLDQEALKGYLTRHRSGVWLLAAPSEPGLADMVSAEAVLTMLRTLNRMFTYVVVDTPPSFSDHVLNAIDESDMLVSITTMDVPSIKNLRVSLQTLEMLGVPRDRIRIVLNRADSEVGLSIGEVEKTLQTKVDVSIPSSRDVPLSINRGMPILCEDGKSQVGRALTDLYTCIDHQGGRDAALISRPRQRFHLRRKR